MQDQIEKKIQMIGNSWEVRHKATQMAMQWTKVESIPKTKRKVIGNTMFLCKSRLRR